MQDSANDDGFYFDKKRRDKQKNQSNHSDNLFPVKYNNLAIHLSSGGTGKSNNDGTATQSNVSSKADSLVESAYSSAHDAILSLKEEIRRKDQLIKKLCSSPEVSSSVLSLNPYPVEDYKPQLEGIISDQNLVIEQLQRNHKIERERALQLESELKFLRDNEIKTLENEVEALNTKLVEKDRNLREEFSETIHKQVEEKYVKKFDEMVLEIQRKQKGEIEKLESQYNNKITSVVNDYRSNEYVLLKEIDVLHSLLEDAVSSGYHVHLAPLSSEVENIKKLLNSAAADGISKQHLDDLAAALANELTLKAEVDSLKTLNATYSLDMEKLKKKMNESLNESDHKYIELEHTLEGCNHDKEKLMTAIGQMSEQNKTLHGRYNELLDQAESTRESVKNEILNSLQPLHSLSLTLKKGLLELANAFGDKVCYKNLIVPPISTEDVLFSLFEGIPTTECSDVKEISLLLRDCHLQKCNLQKLFKQLDFNLDNTTKENRRLSNQMKNMKELCKQKEHHFEHQIGQLNRLLEECRKEKIEIEHKFLQVESSSIPRNEHLCLLAERNQLVAQVSELMASMEHLPKDEVAMSEPRSSSLSSTLLAGSSVSKESFVGWAEICHRLETENKKLRDQVFEANASLTQAHLTRQILDEEVSILKANIDTLRTKLSNYVELKEKCLILENERDLLDFKMKHIINQHLSDDPVETHTINCDGKLTSEKDDGTQPFSSQFNLIKQLSYNNRRLVAAEERLELAEREAIRAKLKLVNSDELVKSLQDKVESLLKLLNSEQSSCQELSNKNTELAAKVKVLEIQGEALSYQVDLLHSIRSDSSVESTSLELIEKIRSDSLLCLKQAVEKLSDAERCRLEIQWEDPAKGTLDARRREEILEKSTAQLHNEVERLHLKLAELQQVIHSSQNNSDGPCFDLLGQLERQMLDEMESHRQQHARIEEALRSTGGLLNDLQQNKDLVRTKIREIMNLQKKVEEEKHTIKEMEIKQLQLEVTIKEKNTLLENATEQKKLLEHKLSMIEEESTNKEFLLNSKILKSQWEAKNCKIKLIANQVSNELITVERLTAERLQSAGGWNIHEGGVQALRNALDYDNTLATLSRCWDADRAALLASTQKQLVEKADQYQQAICQLTNRIDALETENILAKLNLIDEGNNIIKSNKQRRKSLDDINRELRDLENSLEGDNLYLFAKLKAKFKTYYDQQLLYSINKTKEDHQHHSEAMMKALKELHNEELSLVKLNLEADKHSALYNLTQEQFKEQKNVINTLTQCFINSEKGIFHQLQDVLIKDFIIRIQSCMRPWEKSFSDEFNKLEHSFKEFVNNFNEETNLPEKCSRKADSCIGQLENLLSQEDAFVEKGLNFVQVLKDYYNYLVKALDLFVSKSYEKLNENVSQMKAELSVSELYRLQDEIKKLNLEKEELEEKHKAAVQLLISDHEEEVLKIRCFVEQLAVSTKPYNESLALSNLRADLERKHADELEDLRAYFERKCSEMEKHEFESQCGCPEETKRSEEAFMENLKDSNLSDDLVESLGKKFKRCVASVVANYKSKLDNLTCEVSTLQNALREAEEHRQLDFTVGGIVREARHEGEREAEWINALAYDAAIKEAAKDAKEEGKRQATREIGRLSTTTETRLVVDLSGVGFFAAAQQAAHHAVMAEQMRAADECAERLDSLDAQWESGCVSQLGSLISERAIDKVKFEEEVKSMILHFEFVISKCLGQILEKHQGQFDQISKLEESLGDLQDVYKDKILRIKEKFFTDKEVLYKNCDNLVNQIELEAKKSCDIMKNMYEAELANITSCHRQEMEQLERNLRNEMKLLKESEGNYNLSEEELYNKAKEQAISHVVEGIVSFISNEERGENVLPLPLEFETLESIFANKYKKLMEEQLRKHTEEIESLKSEFNQTILNLAKQNPVQEECEESLLPTGDKELDRVIRERDCLKKLNETLRSAVQQLTSYLTKCEDELNRTVVEELVRTGTPRKHGLPSLPRRVHFAPDISTMVDSFSLDSSAEVSGLTSDIRSELENCLTKLKKEAAAILGLTAGRPSSPEDSSNHYLQDKARYLLNERESSKPTELLSVIEEITYEGDSIIDDLRQEKEDLIEQVKAADSQLKSTRKFLEDQAAERENERDEYSREVHNLRIRIKDSRQPDIHLQEWSEVAENSITPPTSLHRRQIEDLELQLNAVGNDLKESEDHRKDLESELKNTLEKVWVLTDIINKLENEIITKSEREEWLEKRLDELEIELEQQSATQQAMQEQMEAMKTEESKGENYVEHMMALQEEIKRQYSSSSVRLMKSQLKDIENGIEQRIKELESLNLNGSTTSLSSPSEEISIRDHLEALRSETPDCPSPVALPIDLVNNLQDKIAKHFRAEDMIIKKCKDLELQLKKLTSILNEVQAERDVLVSKVEQSKGQLVEAGSKIDDLRLKAETARQAATKDLFSKVSRLEEELTDLQRQLDMARTELEEREDELHQAKAFISEQNQKMSSQTSSDIVNSLRLELASVISERNALQSTIDRLNKSERDVVQLTPLYDVLLDDKNQDIKQLQRTVSFLQSQLDQSVTQRSESTYREHRSKRSVSFSEEDVSPIRSSDALRDAPSDIFHMPMPVDLTQSKIADSNTSVMSRSLKTITLEDIEEEETDGVVFESEVEELRQIVKELSAARDFAEQAAASVKEELNSVKIIAEKQAAEAAEKFQTLFQDFEVSKAEMELLKDAKDEVDRLKIAVAMKDEHIQKTTEDVKMLQDTLSRLQEKVKQASVIASEDGDLKSELISLKEKYAALETSISQFDSLKEQLLSLGVNSELEEESGFEIFKDIIRRTRDKLNELSQKHQLVNDLAIEVDQLKEDNTRLNQKLSRLQATPVNNETIADLKAQVDCLKYENSKVEKLKNELVQLQGEKSKLSDDFKKLEMSRNLINKEYDQLKLDNLKRLEEIALLKTKIYPDTVDGGSQTLDSRTTAEKATENVPGLEALTSEIEKQLDLSAQLDHSLLSSLSETPSKRDHRPFVSSTSHGGGDVGSLRQRLESESDKWRVVDQKQSQLASQVDNLTRLVASQDQRITHMAVQLDEKKNQCLVLELDLLRERSELKQLQCILETERQKARTIQKEDTNLIETLRLRLEACMRAESQLKAMLLEEREKCDTLQACLNSARALEKYVTKSTLQSPTHNSNEVMVLRIEVERLKQHVRDLEDVISRERQSQAKMKDKLRALEVANSTLDKQCEMVKRELADEVRGRESAEERARIAEQFVTNRLDPLENDYRLASLAQEIHQWKEECLELREHLQLQLESQDRWTANVQSPLMRQLSEVNRSLEKLVGEKIGLQTHLKDLEKERNVLLRRVRQLEEVCSSKNKLDIATSSTDRSSLTEKFEEVMEAYQILETFRKSLVWQKKYLLITLAGYQRSHEENLSRLNVPPSPEPRKKRSFRIIALTVCATIKLNSIHRRRSARRKMVTLKVLKQSALPKPTVSAAAPNVPAASTGAFPPPWLSMEMDMPEELLDPSKLRHYVVMFDDLQKRLGRILQES